MLRRNSGGDGDGGGGDGDGGDGDDDGGGGIGGLGDGFVGGGGEGEGALGGGGLGGGGAGRTRNTCDVAVGIVPLRTHSRTADERVAPCTATMCMGTFRVSTTRTGWTVTMSQQKEGGFSTTCEQSLDDSLVLDR